VKDSSQPLINEPVLDYDRLDVFMSRTDERGVIQFGNDTFFRLSGYSWDELDGAPHKVIRHPDMPKSVFWLMWETLKAGRPFAGYVKNRAKSGRYYWVFAVILPVQDGYLSVRLNPCEEIIETIKALYATLLEQEKSGELTLEQGGAKIIEAVQDLGFRDYANFMAYALSKEYANFMTLSGKVPDKAFLDFEKITAMCEELKEDVSKIISQVQSIRSVPANLKVLGARLEQGGASIQILAQDYETTTQTLLSDIARMSGDLEVLLQAAQRGRFGISAGLVYRHAIDAFRRQGTVPEGVDKAKEVRHLETVLEALDRRISASDRKISQEFENYATLSGKLRKHLTGLAMNRIMCRIESAILNEDTDSIEAIVTQLSRFQEQLSKALDRVLRNCQNISARRARNSARSPVQHSNIARVC
jgi:PAS domain S-box-containing protein